MRTGSDGAWRGREQRENGQQAVQESDREHRARVCGLRKTGVLLAVAARGRRRTCTRSRSRSRSTWPRAEVLGPSGVEQVTSGHRRRRREQVLGVLAEMLRRRKEWELRPEPLVF